MNDVKSTTDQTVNYKIKICPIILLIVSGIIIGGFGYLIGKTSSCNSPVLGVQSDSLGTRLLALWKFNLVPPTQDINQFKIQNNTSESTNIEPSPDLSNNAETEVTPEPSSSPSMIYGGINRTKPTAQPSPFDSTETDRLNGNTTKHKSSPDPTPKYKTDWDRTLPSPSPKINPVLSETVKQIIAQNGIDLQSPEITPIEGENKVSATGTIKDKLFGFLPISFPAVIVVDNGSGEVTQVQVPWWRTLFGNFNLSGVSQIRCGDGICTIPKENPTNCPYDCTGAVCGNGICE